MYVNVFNIQTLAFLPQLVILRLIQDPYWPNPVVVHHCGC